MLALQWWSIAASAGYLEELAQSGPDVAVVSGAVGECDFFAGGDTVPLTRCDFTVGAVFVAGETEPSGVIDVWRPGGSTTRGGFVAPLGAPLVQPEHDHVLVLKNESEDGRWWVRRSVWRADVAGVGPMAVERERRVTFDAERGWVPTRESVKIIPDATWTEVLDVQMNSVDSAGPPSQARDEPPESLPSNVSTRSGTPGECARPSAHFGGTVLSTGETYFHAGLSTPNACDWACEVAKFEELVAL